MGDTTIDRKLLLEEQYRLGTFSKQNFVKSVNNSELAKAGFFLIPGRDVMKCFACNLEAKAADFGAGKIDVFAFHREKQPRCSFVRKFGSVKFGRWRTFRMVSDSLRFEKARLDTFINWPLTFISPADLAMDGFYYLRVDDHCACAYCKGIIGAWEEGDSPRTEHAKHYPRCPFVRGEAVGNVPMAQSFILSKFNHFTSAKLCNSIELNCMSRDVTGHGRQPEEQDHEGGTDLTQRMNGINLREIGLHEYRGPKHKEYITLEARLNSFKKWPENIKVQPQDLSEAGFYYCGISDHVRCFHCGYGIFNWEVDDVPWEVHATWYPECSYVLITKGQEFVNKVQKIELCDTAGNSQSFCFTESELDSLMQLDVNLAVKGSNISEGRLRAALRKKLQSTGLPFTCFEECMDALFCDVGKETEDFLNETYQENGGSDQQSAEATTRHPTSSDSVNGSTLAAVSAPLPTDPPPQGRTTPLTELPRPADPSSILPLPQLRSHCPIINCPIIPLTTRAESRRDNSRVNGTLGTAREPSIPQQRQPMPVQSDFSAVKIVKNELMESPASVRRSADADGKSNAKLQEELDKAREVIMCKVCLSAEMNIVFLPCSHMATCSACAVNLSKCPVCRGDIKYTIKPIVS